jgi:RNA polymerase sigma-70 factor (ECF subfamily)
MTDLLPPLTNSDTDWTLLRYFRDGNEEAAERLYHRYVRRLAALVRSRSSTDLASRIDVEDVLQSVFRTFFERAKDGRYDVPDGDDLWKLLLVLTLNKMHGLRDFHCAARRDVRRTAVGLEQDEFAGPSEHSLVQLAIRDTLEGLPERYQQIVALRVEGHEIADIAVRTGRSRRTVERVLQEVRERLGSMVEKE